VSEGRGDESDQREGGREDEFGWGWHGWLANGGEYTGEMESKVERKGITSSVRLKDACPF
jgi:hypothetical protein